MALHLTPAQARSLLPHTVRTRHKYGIAAPEARTYNGIVYHSATEARQAWELDCQQQAGTIAGWQRQVRFPLVVNGVLVGHYVADFVVQHHQGPQEIIEVKGYWTAKARLVWALFLACYGAQGWIITVRQV